MQEWHCLEPLDAAGLVRAVLRVLGTSLVAIECEKDAGLVDSLRSRRGVTFGVVAPFRHEFAPDATMVVATVDPSSVDAFVDLLAPNGRLSEEVAALQIATRGQIQFRAGDYFHPECISAGPMLPAETLRRLVEDRLIRRFDTPEEARARVYAARDEIADN